MKWFKHDTDAIQDAKIKKLIMRHGATGYAVYFHCLELIAGNFSESNVTFELEHDSEIIADNLKIQGTADRAGVAIVEDIMRYIVELQLFEESAGRIFCFKLLKRLDSSMTSNSRLREVIAHAKESHDRVMIESCRSHDKVMIKSCKTRLEETRREENIDICANEIDKPVYNPEPVSIQQTAASRYETARKTWNDAGQIECLKTMFDATESERSAILSTLRYYPDERIAESIANYASIRASPEHEITAPYRSLQGFIRGGVEKFVSSADPWSAYKKRRLPSYRDQEEEDRARILAQFGEKGST